MTEKLEQKKRTGIYGKFIIKRSDGTHRRGKKHERCDYFVLDITHDPFAAPALRAYAGACEADGYQSLASDLRDRAFQNENMQARTIDLMKALADSLKKE